MICWGFLIIFECQMAVPPPIVVCPPLREWPLAYQRRLADELERQPKGTAIAELARQHLQLRERLRKCRMAATKK
jgi:hypothetical protein